MLSDFIRSHIRTWVPMGVGFVLTYLGDKLHIVFDLSTTQGVVMFVSTVIGALYYLLVRLLEKKWPSLGWLLGSPNQPNYASPSTP